MSCEKLIQVFSIVCVIFACSVFASPRDLALTARDVLHTNATTPTFNAFARIRDLNGVDITSSFKVKVFHKTPATPSYNVTGGSKLHDREVFEIVRMVDKCYDRTETFIESHCTPKDEKGSLQTFKFTCRKLVDHWHAITGTYMGMRPAYQSREGECDASELCMDSVGKKHVASCVHAGLFDDFTFDKDGRVKGMLFGEVFDVLKAQAYLTDTEKNEPLETKSMEVGAWIDTASLSTKHVQSKSCRDCAELGTDLLQPATDSLKVEATLLTAGAIAGGVLWLALSG